MHFNHVDPWSLFLLSGLWRKHEKVYQPHLRQHDPQSGYESCEECASTREATTQVPNDWHKDHDNLPWPGALDTTTNQRELIFKELVRTDYVKVIKVAERLRELLKQLNKLIARTCRENTKACGELQNYNQIKIASKPKRPANDLTRKIASIEKLRVHERQMHYPIAWAYGEITK